MFMAAEQRPAPGSNWVGRGNGLVYLISPVLLITISRDNKNAADGRFSVNSVAWMDLIFVQ